MKPFSYTRANEAGDAVASVAAEPDAAFSPAAPSSSTG